MKHRALSLVVLMASLAATAGTISKTYNFSSSQVEVNSVSTDNGSRSMVTYNGLDNTTDIGAPSIPVKSVMFKVPDNAINISVSAQTSGAISISLPDSIYYVPAVTTSGGVAVGAAIQNSVNSPACQAELTNIGYVGGDRKIVAVNIYPVSVGQDNMSITAYNKVSVKITYSLGNDTDLTAISPTNPTLRNKTAEYLKSVVENPLLVSASPIDAVLPLTSDMDVYDYIIITPRRYMKSFERLAAMRRTQGYGAKIFALESVLNFQSSTHPNTEIDDDAGKLRYFLKNAYESWRTRNVLLAGRFPEMPLRIAWRNDDGLPPNNQLNPIEYRIPTDIYFEDLNSNWVPGTEDGTFEFSTAYPDVFREINIGRLNIGPNPEWEIKNYTDKVRNYEFVNPKINGEYLGKALMTMPIDPPFNSSYQDDAKSLLTRIFTSGLNDMCNVPDKAFVTGAEVINSLNSDPVGCLALYGHGNPGSISLDWYYHGIVGMDNYEYDVKPESGNGLDNLTTADYPSWMYSVGCMVAPNDYSNFDGTYPIPTPYHFADAYTIANPTGGVAFLGNTRASWGGPGKRWTERLLNTIIKSNGSDTEIHVGDLKSASLSGAIGSYLDVREYYIKTLIGDPLCRLFVHQPVILSALENADVYNGAYRTYNIDSGKAILYVGCAPVIDASYAYRTTADKDSIKNHTNTVTCVYTASSAPEILPLHLENTTIWQYSSPYIFADNVFIGDTAGGDTDNVIIASGAEVTIEALGEVKFLDGLYIQDNATLSIIADGIVSLSEIHMGENATLNITAWDILNDKGWAVNDGTFNYLFIKRCNGSHINEPSKAKKTFANDYTPMVVEGKTWWQATERYPDRWNREFYYYIEVGFTIGSEVEIDGVKWNKLYISHYRDGVNYKDGVRWNEDESLLGYIREEDRRVITSMDCSPDIPDRYKSLFGETYGIFIPMYILEEEATNVLVYDFNKRDYYLGRLDEATNSKVPTLLKYVGEEVVNNSDIAYRKYTYINEEGYMAEGEKTYFIEGIGMPESVDWARECLFFLPMVNRERTALSELKLRYVTDKDYNILYEQEGGVKLWDEMAGVGNVAVDSSYDSEPVWYNMQGVKVAEPTSPGIYIRKAGNNTAKVVVK